MYIRADKNSKMCLDITNIRNIIFDLGKVILNLNFDASVNAFRKLGMDGQVLDHQQAYTNPVFYELETGRIQPEEFRDRIRHLLNRPELTDNQIDDAWYAMILDIPRERVDTIHQLSSRFNVYLFSNTNKIHIDRLHADFKIKYGFEFSSLFVKDFYSHEICERKPDISAYLRVIEMSGIRPEETIFVDDLEKNIEGAKKAGLHTFWLKENLEMADVFSMENIFRV